MKPTFLDVVMPSPSLGDILGGIVADNSVGIILLLVAELLIASGIVIGIVLRKQTKNKAEANNESEEESNKENEQL
jgi:hypothetical protein